MGRDFKNIKAWQLANQFTLEIYRLTKMFPKEELYGITSQIRRAAVSVPSNIAEGATRNYNKEYLQFLYVAKGSLAESEYLLYLADQLGYLDAGSYEKVERIRVECAKTLFGLIRAVQPVPD